MNMNNNNYTRAREKMVETQIKGRGITDQRIISAFLKVPRHRFVEDALADQSYSDFPLPIGLGQTISQPYIVALMAQVLELKEADKVLEIGTGSGYAAAILAEIVKEVYTIERIPKLLNRASKLIYELEYGNVKFRAGDGTLGWADAAPFDAIMVSAGANKVPPNYVKQLAEGGRIVIPVGGDFYQDLLLVRKKEGKIVEDNLGGCRFVRLVGKEGWATE